MTMYAMKERTAATAVDIGLRQDKSQSPNPKSQNPSTVQIMRLGGWDLGFGIWDLGFGIWDLGFGVWALGFWRLGCQKKARTGRESGLTKKAEFEGTPLRRSGSH